MAEIKLFRYLDISGRNTRTVPSVFTERRTAENNDNNRVAFPV